MLQAKAAELKSSLDASHHETNEQIKARVARAKAKADAAKESVHGQADKAADRAHAQWQSFKADTSAKMAELHEQIERKRDEHDVKAAERDAEGAEDNAADALDYAAWAIDEAEDGSTRRRRCSRLGRCASGCIGRLIQRGPIKVQP